MNYQTWHTMQVIARDVLGDDVKKMLLGVHDDNGLTKWQRQHHGRRAPYVQIERYAATNRFAIDLKPVEVLALELLAHISKFARLVDYADEWTPEKLEKPVESVVQAMLAKLREKLDPDSEVTPEQLEKAKKLEANYRMGFIKPVTPEQLKTNWQETRRICTKLAPYLPEPDCAALLALLPPVEDDAPVVEETVEQRQARHLDLYETEAKRKKVGALKRLADREGIDRSKLGKDIKKAKLARDGQKPAAGWTSQLVKR